MSSATDVNANEANKANGEVPQRTMRANPVALEVPVSVAGGAPDCVDGQTRTFHGRNHHCAGV